MKKSPLIAAATLFIGLSSSSFLTAASGLNKLISNSVVEGAIEIESAIASDFAGDNSNDLTTATVELVIDSVINENITSHILLLHEDGGAALEVDEAFIQITLKENVTLTAGQLYLPFGSYETNMISDSLSHEFSEARETAVQLDYEAGPVNASLYVFNGDVLETGSNDVINSIGFNIAYTTDETTVGLSYNNNLSDSDLITETLATTPDAVSYVAGLSVYATASFDKASMYFEFITALDEFDMADITFNGNKAKPSTSNLELAYETDNAIIAIAFQTSKEALDLGLPESRLLLSYSMEVMRNTSLAFELASDKDYSTVDSGAGKTASAFTTQLAVAF